MSTVIPGTWQTCNKYVLNKWTEHTAESYLDKVSFWRPGEPSWKGAFWLQCGDVWQCSRKRWRYESGKREKEGHWVSFQFVPLIPVFFFFRGIINIVGRPGSWSPRWQVPSKGSNCWFALVLKTYFNSPGVNLSSGLPFNPAFSFLISFSKGDRRPW